ncbi:MAG TPA: amino acid permease [Steroidobacteraceae bacterium]|nr:amino acid permease [Steroidobacteraceae bacterium]
MTEQEQATLPRLLGFKDLVYLTVGGVIGSGIFIVPASVLQLTGAQLGPALLVWIAGGVLSTLGAFTYAELGAMKPECGGLYVYIRDAFGGFVAFLYGWALFFVISSATNATLAVAFASYLGELMPLSPWAARGVAVAMVAAITVINVIGTRQSADVQNWTTLLKVAAILIMSVLLLARGDGLAAHDIVPSSLNLSMLSAMGAAMIGVLWAYEGWHYTTFSAGEVVEPQRNFARGIIVGTAALIFIYVLANLAYVAALGATRGAQSERIAADAVSTIFGGGAGKAIAVAILISMFSAANATALTATRVYFAMARDGVFFNKMAEVHPRWNTPAFAIVASSIWSAVLAMSGTFDQLLTYVVFAGWIFYGLGAGAVFYYRRRDPHAPRPFRVPGYPVTPVLFMLAAGVVVVNTFFVSPGSALRGIGLILIGVPAYLFWRRAPDSAPGSAKQS